MKAPLRPRSAFTLPELLTATAVLVAFGLLVWIAIPRLSCGPTSSRWPQKLANARALQQAIQVLTLDHEQSGKPGIRWTTWKSEHGASSLSLATLFETLKAEGYVSEADLHKILDVPKDHALSADAICFTIYAVDDESPADQVLLTTKNLALPEGKSRETLLGEKGFVYFTKGGGGGIRTRPADAADTRLFPAGPAYRYVPLK